MDKHAAKYEISFFMFIASVIIIVACAFAAMRIAIHFGCPFYLSFIPLIFGVCVGIVIAIGLGSLACRFMQAKKTANG